MSFESGHPNKKFKIFPPASLKDVSILVVEEKQVTKLIFSEGDFPSPLVGKTLGRVALASLVYVKVRVWILPFTRV